MSADVQLPQPPPQPKYSRYRSVRQAAAATPKPAPTAATPPMPTSPTSETIQRSRSRYHRPSKPAQVVGATIPSVPALPRLQTQTTAPPPPPPPIPVDLDRPSIDRTEELRLKRATLAAQARRRQKSEQHEESAHEPSVGTRTVSGKSAGAPEYVQPPVAESTPLRLEQLAKEAEAAQILAEQKRKDLERLQAELAAAAEAPPRTPPSEQSQSSPTSEKRGIQRFLTRKRAKSKGGESRPSVEKKVSEEVPRLRSIEQPRNVLLGGVGVAPGNDAPKSAVNAGERRVLIRCQQSSINLPVNPETTPVDLIYSAANTLSNVPPPSTAILVEAYTQLGLERRIRRYEHVRDILNSWDRDTQNALLISQAEGDSPTYASDLEESHVPKAQPADVTVYMYHSRKPGKWDKRYITLLSTGQIYTSKKKAAKMTDKDVVPICHLTDFDIYTPTAEQIRKNLRPPKRFCYAVKSQQRPSMFLDTEKFVHFFSCDDEATARKWHDACQAWRSWYLVNMLGEGGKSASASKTREERRKTVGYIPDMRLPNGGKVEGHKVKVSVDEDPYTIGSFKPFLDLGRFASGSEASDESALPDVMEEGEQPRQGPLHLRHGPAIPKRDSVLRRERGGPPPPAAFGLLSGRRGGGAAESGESSMDSGTFAATGLLGRTYSQRQKMQRERDAALASPSAEGPFVPGPSLLNSVSTEQPWATIAGVGGGDAATPLRSKSTHHHASSSLSRRPTTAAAATAGAGALGRSHTQKTSISRAREPPKPLIDLTPQFKEPPQWRSEGKGHGVDARELGVRHLVEGAKGGEVVDPLGTVFRRG